MVLEYEAPSRYYQYSFEFVMKAYEMRFPVCPQVPEMTNCEITHENETPDGVIWTIWRRCEITLSLPYLIQKACGLKKIYFLQKNVLNRLERTLSIETTNETFHDSVELWEYCKYMVHAENPDHTFYTQNARMNVKSFFGFESTVEKLIKRFYSQSLDKGKAVMDTHIEELLNSGISSVPIFTLPHKMENMTIRNDSGVFRVSEENIKGEEKNCATVAPSKNISEQKISDSDKEVKSAEIFDEEPVFKIRTKLKSRDSEITVPDEIITRFLKASDFNIDLTYERLVKSIIWRREYYIDKIMEGFELPHKCSSYFIGCWLEQDNDGCPVYLLKLGMMDIKGLLKTVGAKMILGQVLRIHYEAERKMLLARQKTGRNIITWTCIVDLEGLNIRHIWRPAIKTALNIMQILEENFPESVSKVLITRAPRVFGIIWNLICAFINERTNKKCRVFPSVQDNFSLYKYIDKEYLPIFLGGCFKCEDRIESDSGPLLIPKENYQYVTDNDQQMVLLFPAHVDSYKTYTTNKQKALEIDVPIYESNSLITWDFDVVEGDVSFSALYLTSEVVDPAIVGNNASSIGSGIISTFEKCSSINISNRGQKLNIFNNTDINEVSGPYYKINPVLYEESLSIQGSCHCLEAGTYRLRWEVGETCKKPKAVIILYYDVLFGGSVSKSLDCLRSISSIQSDFSPETTSLASSSNSTPS